MQTLEQYLESENISQAAFAEIMDVKQPTVSRWLAGQPPKRVHMIAIERVTEGRVPSAVWFSQTTTGDAA